MDSPTSSNRLANTWELDSNSHAYASIKVSVFKSENPLQGQARSDGNYVTCEPTVAVVWKMFKGVSAKSGVMQNA